MQAGVSSLGIKLAYGVETVQGEKPSLFNVLHRINSIGGITIEPETIDASALEDTVTRSVAGRGDSGGSFAISVNMTNETIAEWNAVIDAYKAIQESGKRMWFEVLSPGLEEAFFVAAQPPLNIPMPDMGQNELLVMEIPLTIDEFAGMGEKIEPTDSDPDAE